ncbi:MAG: rhamnan synthesis F family protein [Pseudomonadota bacterium]
MPEHGRLWKAKREVKRLGTQLAELPSNIASRYFAAPYYDAVHARKIKTTAGDIAEGAKTAIYLIFPSQGVLTSHLHALGWLRDRGISPLVVSNLPLSPDDVERLRPFAWQILERPNVGYDFGGYRDGVLHLVNQRVDLDQLLLLNDSAWFPLPGAQDWLDQVAALNVDYAGAATNFGMPRVDPEQFMDQVWDYKSTHRNFHYTSYALAIGSKILSNPAFRNFWRRFPMSNRKKRTVRRGEIGLTQWVLRNGYSHAAALDLTDLDTALAALPKDQLLALSHNIMVPEDARLTALKARILAGTPDTQTLANFILMATARQGMSYALQAYTIGERGFAFLKKSPLWLNAEARDITLAITSNLSGEAGQMIHEEAKALAAPDTRSS